MNDFIGELSILEKIQLVNERADDNKPVAVHALLLYINEAADEIERLRAERDELLDALIPLANASMPDERALISDEDQERAAALVAKMELRDDDR